MGSFIIPYALLLARICNLYHKQREAFSRNSDKIFAVLFTPLFLPSPPPPHSVLTFPELLESIPTVIEEAEAENIHSLLPFCLRFSILFNMGNLCVSFVSCRTGA